LKGLAGYDFIGDIHGHADELLRLLIKLGYTQEDGVFRHSERQVIFLGDFIDRGPKIREVLETVIPMVQAGYARTVMGNHEFNALAFHTSVGGTEEQSLRPRTLKNIRQHAATIQQLTIHVQTTRASAAIWHDQSLHMAKPDSQRESLLGNHRATLQEWR